MLVDPRLCHHPPFWNCTRCCASDASSWRVPSSPGFRRAKRGFKVQKLPQKNRLKLPEPAAASPESSAEPSTGTLAKPSPELQQTLWTMDSSISGSLPTESLSSGEAGRQSLQVQDDDSWQFRNGPLPGDLAEVEAFCRIFRIAEQVHSAVMQALCSVNEDRECSVSMSNGYDHMSFGDAEVSEIKDVPFLEEKVVSGLGCIGALLHQQKQEVVGERFSGVKSTPFSHDDSMPPLAQFRAEMKRCCEQLEAALCCYFPPFEERFKIMHSKFQRLQNVCFDAGFPRPEGSPSHADIPNWAPVRLWSSKGDRTSDDVQFWRGGQVTEMGVQWLIDKGFKVVVDLRAESGVDQLAKSALDDAVSIGKLRHVKLPVDPGKSPTKDQVMEFAKLVADPQNHPLYLHSQEGVGRTNAMVMRWREIALRRSPHRDYGILDENVPSTGASKEVADEFSEYEHENSFPTTKKVEDGCLDKEHSSINSCNTLAHVSSEEGNNVAIHAEDVGGSVKDFLVPLGGTARVITPFEAQRPPLNIFSKQVMSKFMKGRRFLPASYEWSRTTTSAQLTSAGGDETATPITGIVEPAGRWGLDGPGIPRAGRKTGSLISDDKFKSPHLEDDTQIGKPLVNSRISGLSDNGENSVSVDQGDLASPPNGAGLSVSSGNNPSKGALFRVSGVEGPADDTEEPGVVGDMCASTTGVVRIQSRRKAEMYLVRTDGFSCTRERVKESTLAFTHPSTQQQMLMWKTAPKTVLLLKKLGNELMNEAEQVASFLHHQEGMDVFVERDVHDHLARFPGFGFVQTFYNQDASNLHERVDFVVCLGGDGVILHASNLFRDAVPPVVSFNLGSLGFLTSHPFEDFMQDLRAIIHGNNRVEGVYITLRMRLRCELFHDGKPIPGKVFDVLNEVVVDRGSSPYLCKIECYERNRLITKVQADGVIVATPTGSTAYSTAAGGSMVHPNVPCMLFTPICPHSLSFRPVILPDSALLELKVPRDARSNAWVSFDGKKRQQLSVGDSVRICMSEHPLPTVNKSDQTDDWFRSLVRCLNWNERMEQKGLSVSS